MAWGQSKSHQPSTISQLIPLLLVSTVLCVGAWVGYQIYLGVVKIQDDASKRMGNKNVVFTKDGMRVGVKHVENEKYVDATQSWVVKAWNYGHNGEIDKRNKSK